MESNMKKMCEAFYNAPWANESFYTEYLAQSYFYIEQSTRLLAYAAGHTKGSEKVLFKRMTQHISEEASHEVLCANDLKALGRKIEDFKEMPETAAFYQSQYYKIQHLGASVFLGYIYALETAACRVGPRILQDHLRSCFKPNALTFLKLHAEEDLEHIEDAKKQIENLPVEQRLWVEQNIEATAILFTGLLKSIEEKTSAKRDQSFVGFAS